MAAFISNLDGLPSGYVNPGQSIQSRNFLIPKPYGIGTSTVLADSRNTAQPSTSVATRQVTPVTTEELTTSTALSKSEKPAEKLACHGTIWCKLGKASKEDVVTLFIGVFPCGKTGVGIYNERMDTMVSFTKDNASLSNHPCNDCTKSCHGATQLEKSMPTPIDPLQPVAIATGEALAASIESTKSGFDRNVEAAKKIVPQVKQNLDERVRLFQEKYRIRTLDEQVREREGINLISQEAFSKIVQPSSVELSFFEKHWKAIALVALIVAIAAFAACSIAGVGQLQYMGTFNGVKVNLLVGTTIATAYGFAGLGYVGYRCLKGSES